MTRSSLAAARAALLPAIPALAAVLALAGCAGPGAPSDGGTLADRAQRLRERVEARQARDVVAEAQAAHRRTGRPQAVVCMESAAGERLLLTGDVVAVRSGVPVVAPRGKPTLLARRGGGKKGFGPAQGAAGGGTSSATYTVTDALILGAATTSGVRLDLESGTLAVREGDDSAYAPLTAGVVKANSYLIVGADTGLERPTANILQVTTGTGVNNTACLTYRRRVVAVTADYSLNAAYSNMLSTNEGASGAINLTLPSAVAAPLGDVFFGVVQANQYLRYTAASGDTIRDGSTVSAAAGYIRSTTVGSTICLQAINATEWIVLFKTGTWTIDS